jgi:predicted DNA-binding transcriptional regulator AlpA
MATGTIGRELPRTDATTYLNSPQVRSRYGGMSDMALWRWLSNDELGFPKPIRINRRRFWKESDLTAWARSHRPTARRPDASPNAKRPSRALGTAWKTTTN